MSFDVAARLAEGRPAVANTQAYVDACRAVGYQNPDLTAHGGQVDEWYANEDGLDLVALESDCAALRAAAGAAEEALRIERAAAAAMDSAWSGDSGSAAGEFVERHCASGAAVADALRSSAQVCTALRDKLWGLIDGKVATATAIDDRRSGERAAWLAAARAVTTGAAEGAGATEIVKQQILPYVDGDIRAEWVGAMRSASASVEGAYDEAIQALTGQGTMDFAIPSHLGPPTPPPAAPQAAQDHPAPAPITTPAAAPTAAAAPAAPDLPAASPVPQLPVAPPIPAAPPMTPPAADLASPFGAGPGLGAPAAGGPGLGSGGGLSTLVSEIIDALGGLFDDLTDGATGDLSDAPAVEADAGSTPDAENHPGDPPDQPAPQDEPVDETEKPVPQPESAEQDTLAPPVPEVATSPSEPEPEPVPVIPPPAPPEPDTPTPCDIAADELPQVGQ